MNAERIEELKVRLGNSLRLAALDGRNDDVSDLVDILSILDEKAAQVKAETAPHGCEDLRAAIAKAKGE